MPATKSMRNPEASDVRDIGFRTGSLLNLGVLLLVIRGFLQVRELLLPIAMGSIARELRRVHFQQAFCQVPSFYRKL